MLLPVRRESPRRSPRLLASKVQRLDDSALDRLAAKDHGLLRTPLKLMAVIGNLLVPYLAVTLWLLTRGSEAERTAVVRGWAAAAIAGIVQGWFLKPAARRGRPDAGRLPAEERRKKTPSTSAFPSGHAGASTAFSVATARGARRTRWPLAVVTALLQYAEVYTGRHYPSDLLAGTAIGTSIGMLMGRVRMPVTPPGFGATPSSDA